MSTALSASLPKPSSKVQSLKSRLFGARERSIALISTLSAEDMVVQAMEDASPAKWHLAHVTWFFETFVLAPHLSSYRVFDSRYQFCFNSYYESQGDRQPRGKRGLLTRPSLDDVFAYRAHVDDALHRLFMVGDHLAPDVAELIELGINHEEQHQELLLTDILALFALNPLRPVYREPRASTTTEPPAQPQAAWIEYEGGLRLIGHDGASFAWDNERPRHQALIHPFRLRDHLVTNGEWMEFMSDGGYSAANLWLSDGWSTRMRDDWRAPLYWERLDGIWHTMTLEGLCLPDPCAPVVHVSYFEADAFARWRNARLPTEFEWEIAAADVPISEDDLGSGTLSPRPAGPSLRPGTPRQMFGDVWQWTQSAYLPYPGYKAPEGAIGEYNGKFMVSQQVLRGASCVTPSGHSRRTYRNFFYPGKRWQFAGLRLAREAKS